MNVTEQFRSSFGAVSVQFQSRIDYLRIGLDKIFFSFLVIIRLVPSVSAILTAAFHCCLVLVDRVNQFNRVNRVNCSPIRCAALTSRRVAVTTTQKSGKPIRGSAAVTSMVRGSDPMTSMANSQWLRREPMFGGRGLISEKGVAQWVAEESN